MSERRRPRTLPVGTVHTVPARSRVTVTRPDGTTTTVAPSRDGRAHYVLQAAGVYTFRVGKSQHVHEVEAV